MIRKFIQDPRNNDEGSTDFGTEIIIAKTERGDYAISLGEKDFKSHHTCSMLASKTSATSWANV